MHLLRNAERDAASKGVVGVRDYEMAENIDTWISRFSQGLDGLRVEAGIYPERLRQAIDDGWHTGDELPGSHGLGHVGAMKMISDARSTPVPPTVPCHIRASDRKPTAH